VRHDRAPSAARRRHHDLRPGIALKSEAMNLAIQVELPVIICDVQRGGPSTGLPTKTSSRTSCR